MLTIRLYKRGVIETFERADLSYLGMDQAGKLWIRIRSGEPGIWRVSERCLDEYYMITRTLTLYQ